MQQSMNDIAAKTLGDSTSYAVFTDKFDSSLLNPMPRSAARSDHGITGKEFVGFDVWHCHESTFLLDNGMPVSGTLKFIYPSSSEFMIESKSMKLYLNSFDMCKLGSTFRKAIDNYENQIKNDLESILNCEVKVRFFESTTYEVSQTETYSKYTDVMSLIFPETLESVIIDDYEGKQSHLEFSNQNLPVIVSTNILRSRCRHTKQKDTGSAFISYNSKISNPTPLSVLKQIISLREVNEFHEFCAEKLFVELKKNGSEADINVALLYSRRGSLDINPIRASSISTLYRHNLDMLDIDVLSIKKQGQ